MRKTLTLAALLAAFSFCIPAATAQERYYVDDEECGCELVFVDGIQTTTDGERYGFKRADGTVIVGNIYRYVDNFHGNYCKVYQDDNHCGIIDRTGREVLPCIYQELDYPSENRILIFQNGRAGYADLNGRVVIEPQFLNGGNFSEGAATVVVAVDSFFNACTFIDTLGHLLFQPVYESVRPFNEGYAVVMRYQRYGIIDRSGREVLPIKYEIITDNANGFFFAGDEDAMALFDYSFKPLTSFIYSSTTGLHEGRIGVTSFGRHGFLDRRGVEVIPCIYDDAGIFRLGRTMVAADGHYGIIDTTGRIILPIEYDDNTSHGRKYMYYDSLALVERDGKLGYVDLDGNLAIPFYFDQAFHFTEGLACTRFNGRWGYIDVHGDVFVPHIFDYASPMEWGRAEVVYNGNVSKMDRKGRCVKNCKGVIAWREIDE